MPRRPQVVNVVVNCVNKLVLIPFLDSSRTHSRIFVVAVTAVHPQLRHGHLVPKFWEVSTTGFDELFFHKSFSCCDDAKVIRFGDTLVLQSDKESDKNSKRLGQPIEVVMISIERPIGWRVVQDLSQRGWKCTSNCNTTTLSHPIFRDRASPHPVVRLGGPKLCKARNNVADPLDGGDLYVSSVIHYTPIGSEA